MKYYSPENVAELLNLHPATIRKWIRQGRLHAAKLGSVWRISEEDLQAFIKQDRHESAGGMLEQIKGDHKED